MYWKKKSYWESNECSLFWASWQKAQKHITVKCQERKTHSSSPRWKTQEQRVILRISTNFPFSKDPISLFLIVNNFHLHVNSIVVYLTWAMNIFQLYWTFPPFKFSKINMKINLSQQSWDKLALCFIWVLLESITPNKLL